MVLWLVLCLCNEFDVESIVCSHFFQSLCTLLASVDQPLLLTGDTAGDKRRERGMEGKEGMEEGREGEGCEEICSPTVLVLLKHALHVYLHMFACFSRASSFKICMYKERCTELACQ